MEGENVFKPVLERDDNLNYKKSPGGHLDLSNLFSGTIARLFFVGENIVCLNAIVITIYES